MSRVIEAVASCAHTRPGVPAIRTARCHITYGALPFAIAAEAARIHLADPSPHPVHVDMDGSAKAVVRFLALRQLGRCIATVPTGCPRMILRSVLTHAGASSSLGPQGVGLHVAVRRPASRPLARVHYPHPASATDIRLELTEDEVLFGHEGGARKDAAIGLSSLFDALMSGWDPNVL